MDADKMSRSGRKVKVPTKFQDMEVVDPITGKRTINTATALLPATSTGSLFAAVPKAKPVYTGKRRGRPPRSSLNGTADGRRSVDSNGNAYLEHEQPSPEEEDSADATLSSIVAVNRGEDAGGDHSSSSSSRLHLQSDVGVQGAAMVSGANAAPNSPTKDGAAAVVNVGLVSAPMQSPVKAFATATVGLTPLAKRPRKIKLSPEDGGPNPKRRRPFSSKHYDGHVDIPDGLLDAMRKKRQVTAYFAFCRCERPAVVRDLKDGDFSQYSRELGNRWHALPEDEKVRWRRIAQRVTQILTSERDPEFNPKRSRNVRDKLIRDLDSRVNDPAGNTAFDLVTNLNMVGEQFTNMANCINFVSFTPGSQEPTGCLDAAMDSALVMISSTLGLMAQVPILREYLDVDVLSDLAENSAMVMPLVQMNALK
ncbi:hypothetical protein BV898_17770 [Hypsibius exemplaris]|uniref:HMG box domain-containing protein n=1 Tax=Hypsibius exemplaris TaxID=2072580 RepID=A0A9X6NMU6_HYPEX|nr:hypothetical protein BV898_17770 [Hypsibius exemplaris]